MGEQSGSALLSVPGVITTSCISDSESVELDFTITDFLRIWKWTTGGIEAANEIVRNKIIEFESGKKVRKNEKNS
jgi:hypothetical protein